MIPTSLPVCHRHTLAAQRGWQGLDCRVVDAVVVSILEVEVTYLVLCCQEELTTNKNTHNSLQLRTTDHHTLRLKGGEEVFIGANLVRKNSGTLITN